MMKTNTLAMATAIAALTVGAGCLDPNGDIPTLWYQDMDGDGFGDKYDYNPVLSVTDPSGGVKYSAVNTDCDDYIKAYNPGATEDNTVYYDYNCDGLRTTPPYAIGDYGPAGGTVFYVDTEGNTGLEAAPEDQTGMASAIESWAEWGCSGVEVTGTDTAIGTGATNTQAIAAMNCSPDTAGINLAVDLVTSYSHNGYSDWFLPSKDELNELYLQRAVVPRLDTGSGSGFSIHHYWSSSEYSIDGFAWGQDFEIGSQYGAAKYGMLGVRAVRAF